MNKNIIKQRREINKKVLGSSYNKYFLFLMLMFIGFLLIPNVSAFQFDNIKHFDKDVGKYGKVTIRNSVLRIPFFQLDKVAELELKNNSDICEGFDCYAENEIIMYEKGALIDDIRFLFIWGIRDQYYDNLDYQLYIKKNNKWETYALGEEVDEGTYEVRLESKLPNMWTTIDWQIKSQGYWIEEWAEWTSNLNVNLISYWNMTNITSTLIPDLATGLSNMTIHRNGESFPLEVPGIIGNAQRGYKTNQSVFNVTTNTNRLSNLNRSFSYSLWLNNSDDCINEFHFMTNEITSLGFASAGCQFIFVRAGVIELKTDGVLLNDSEYHHLVIVINSTTGIDFYLDGVLNMSNGTLGTNSLNGTEFRNGPDKIPTGISESQVISFDEIGVWNRTLSASEVTQLYNNGQALNFTQAEVLVELLDPPDANNTISNIVNFNASGTTSEGNVLNNATLHVWDPDGALTTNFTDEISGEFNTTLLSLPIALGVNQWNYEFCSNSIVDDPCQFAENNNTINGVNFIEESQTFNNVTTEGSTEVFSINFTKRSSLQVSTVDLVYNDTPNSFAYSVNEDQIFSQGSVIIPTLDNPINLSFFWNITFDDGSFANTSIQNQSALTVNIDNCSSFSNLIYNFTHLDEAEKTVLGTNNTMEIEVNMFDLSKTLLLINFSQKFINTNPAQICLETPILQTVNYSSYVTVKYFANITSNNETYSIEYHNILNETIANATIPKNIDLFNLKESETTKFRLTFRDGDFNLAPNILVNVFRKYVEDNDFKLVEVPLTDSNGQTMLNLVRNNIIYNFVMVDEGRNIVATFNSVTAFCQDFTIGDCTINLNSESTSEEAYDYNEEFQISITEPIFDNSSQEVKISFVTDDLSPLTVSIEVFRSNQFGNRSACSNTLTAASGTIGCNVSSIIDIDQFLFVHFFVEGSLANVYTINLNSGTLHIGTANGSFFAFLLILFIITMFMGDKKIMVIALGLGWVACLALGLIRGAFVGAASSGIWLLVIIGIYLWKLNKEDSL